MGKNNGHKILVSPLGGAGEIGKNMTAVEYAGEMVILDAGLAFPEDDLPGVDVVIPDMTYVEQNKARVRGVFLSHGHEDHIGAMPYLLRILPDVPVFGSRLTLGMVSSKLREHNRRLSPASREIAPGERVRAGRFEVESFHVNHSIPGSLGFALHTSLGAVIYTGDFKFDYTPVDGEVADLQTLARLGNDGVLLLLADSTNVERPGVTPSERTVGETFMQLFATRQGRILIATFASNVHRIQQVIDAAVRYGRQVAVTGRSMENTVEVAIELGYLNVPKKTLVTIEAANRLAPEKVAILTTGSQGEPTSALTRMSTGDHRTVEIIPGDTVILSATPVPGNEKSVHRTVDNLFRLGAEVIYEREANVHVSGHGSREELKLMHRLLRPRWFIPVHGEYRHLVKHAQMARDMGMADDHVRFGENGVQFEITAEHLRIIGRVPAGRVMVDGLGVGNIGQGVLRDRRQLAQDGVLIVAVTVDKATGTVKAGPEVVSRGFVFEGEAAELIEAARTRVLDALRRIPDGRSTGDGEVVKGQLRDAIGQLMFERTRRRPMILPVVLEA